MGAYLTTPVKTKERVEGENKRFSFASVCMQGWRTNMEDAHIQSLNFDGEDKAIFGVFDGHGGQEMAKYVEKVFISELLKQPEYKAGNYKAALEANFLRMDELVTTTAEGRRILNNGNGNSGCTANVVLIVKDKIYCANSGDSRAIIMRGGNAFALSVDHKPETPTELSRIEKAGGTVTNGRVNGSLNLSRALGDLEFKKNNRFPGNKNPKEYIITAFPDITETSFTPDINLIILGCDGIWECKTNQYIVEYFNRSSPTNLVRTCEDFLDSILAPDTSTSWGLDNMSVIAIRVNHQKQ